MNQPAVATLAKQHRAWCWRSNGSALDLTLQTRAMPTPDTRQVLIRNAVIGLNPVDWKVIAHSPSTWREGHVPGVDAAGVVVAVGAEVSASWIGVRVAFHTDLNADGTFAEYVAVNARALLRIPDSVDFEIAASLPCPALTAWLAIEKIPVQVGQPLLISGAGGAVGNYLVQFAAMRGFEVVALAHPRHAQRLRALGAKSLIEPFEGNEISDKQRRFYAVIDSVGADHAMRMSTYLQANGHLVCIQGRVPGWVCSPFGLTLSLHEVALGALHVYGDDAAWSKLVTAGEHMLAQIADGALKPEARIVHEFETLPQCLEDLRHRNFFGKALVRLA